MPRNLGKLNAMAQRPIRPKRILLIKIRPDKIGDVLLATPLIRSLKQLDPGLELTMWVHPAIADVLANNPDLQSVGATTFRPSLGEGLDHVKRMRAGKFDAVIFLKDRAGSHIPLSWLAGIPRRIGSVGKKWYGKLLTQNIDMAWDSVPTHEAELCYQLVERAVDLKLERLPMSMPVKPEDEVSARELLSKAGVNGDYFCLQAGTGGTSRPWSPENLADVAKQVIAGIGYSCVLTGMKGEIELVSTVAKLIGDSAYSIAGQTDLKSMAAILKGAKGLITGSTGTLHLAAAQETPIILIEPLPGAEARISKWHPWMSPYKAFPATKVCDGCTFKHCIETGNECLDSISANEVAASAVELFKP